MKVEVIKKKIESINTKMKLYTILAHDMPINNYYATNNFAKDIAISLNIDYNKYLKIMIENYKGFVYQEHFGIYDIDSINYINCIGFFDYDDAKKAVDWINSIILMNTLNDAR